MQQITVFRCPDCEGAIAVKEGYPKYIHVPRTKIPFLQTIYECSNCDSLWIICKWCGKLREISKYAVNTRYCCDEHRVDADHFRNNPKRYPKRKKRKQAPIDIDSSLPYIGTCNTCGSNNIIYDHETQEVVCKGCGLVLFPC
jgi:ribosomal protein S27E